MSVNLLPKLPKLFASDDSQRQRQVAIESDLLRREAAIGGMLFGPVPKGHNRQFFCLDQHTWIWHEEWFEGAQRHSMTTRYDVRPTGVIKSQDGQANKRLSREEAEHLYRAALLYQQHVEADYQRQLQTV